MAASLSSSAMASVAIFCPQSKAPQENYLDQLHSFLCHNKYLKPFLNDIINLQDVWWTFANEREDIAALDQGPRYMQNLSEWITTGKSAAIANSMSGIISLPLLVIIQIGQYFQYLELHGARHADYLASLRKGGGVQGYCGGLPPAIAIACSKDEEEVVKNAAITMRIALGIGAYGELGDDANIPGATTIVVRLKRVGQGEDIVNRFPGSFISAITDPKTISMVGSVPVLAKVQAYAREQGLLVQEMHIRGKVHNPENVDLAKELCNLCDRIESLQLPNARDLQAPVRSNRTGEAITKGSLTHEVVNTILASRCEWYTLLTELARDLDLTGRRSHLFATFGIGDCVPLSPFHKLQLQITKLDVLSFISEHISSAREPSLEDHYSFPKDAVAVIGASCRLPGANSLDELWSLMSQGTSRHVEVPNERFNLHGSFRASQDWKFAGKRKFYGNFIDGVENFDHAFFGTNPKEAMNMDPQQRILLEAAYQAMESSGYLHSHQREAGDPVGCFIGASFVEYLDNTNANPPSAYTSTGTIRAFLCGKLSYFFGWSGPAEVLDTACSSSLVAINRACKAVQTGECTLALTGGVNLMTGINNYLDLAKAGFLSPTGQCKPFDQSADGYCRSEGAGLVVLKMLNQAVADGDQILGVIPGVATNQGGLSSSITVPSSPAQIKLYKTVLRQAGMKPDHISYVEAHGTGTQAGDPLEVASIREVFGGADRSSLLHLGSIKGNMGHCETAAGVAGLLKILVMIKESRIPPQASHGSLNPKIPSLKPDKMCIDSKAERWDVPLRAACVNSYGAAGSNAALLCCEGPRRYIEAGTDAIDVEQLGATYPIILSAASKESLHAYAESLQSYLQRTVPKPRLGDLAFTLSERRKRHRHRFITTASDIASLMQSLKSDAHKSFEAPQKPRRVIMAFGGQSKRTVGLEESLYQCHRPLRRYIDSCNDIIIGLGFSSILPCIFQSDPIENLVALHCGTFAVQYASARCWLDAGLEVDTMIGHSFGELTAMAACGILSLHDGLKLIATRARLMESRWGAEKGQMLAINASPEMVQDVMASLEIACYNARFRGIRSHLLDVSHGFHSKFTEPLLADLDQMSASLTFSEPRIHLETCTSEQLPKVLPNRPSQHTREPVRFSDAVRRIEKRLGPSVWLEAGLNAPILPMVRRAVTTPDDHFFQAVNVKDARVPIALFSDVTANLWQQGVLTSYWDFIAPKNSEFRQVWLPPYQFQPTPHWLANIDRVVEAQQKIPEAVAPKEEPKQPTKPLRLVSSQDIPDGGGSSKHFQINVATQRFTRIVSGHAVRQRPLCPASMYMECAAMAVQILQGGLEAGTLFFEDLVFQAALGVDLSREVLLTLEESHKKSWTFIIKSKAKADSKSRYVTHGKGRVGLAAPPNLKSYERLISNGMSELAGKANTEKLMSIRAYGLFAQVVHYAPFLQAISHITMDGTQAMANIDLPVSDLGTDESTATQFCDTISIDAFIQVVGLLINSSSLVTSEDVYVATGVDSTAMSSKCDLNSSKSWTVYTRFVPSGDSQAMGDIFVLTREANLVMTIVGVHFTKLLISNLEKFLDSANAKPAKPQVTAPETKFVPALPALSSETTSEEEDGLSADTTPATSMTSSPGEFDTLDTSYNEAAESLTNIIVEYTGLAAEDIGKDALMSDLGVDSLAAVEFAEELQSRFGGEITPEDLLVSSQEALCKLLLPTPSAKGPLPNGKTVSSHIEAKAPAAAQPAPKSQSTSIPQNSKRRQKVLQLISESSGAPVDSMHDEASLQDLGVDSLSAVELKGEFEDAFSMEIDDDALSLESTLKEVMEFLGVAQAHELTPPPVVASKPRVDVTEDSTPGQKLAGPGQSGGPTHLANPVEALIESEASFNDAADQRGFSRYWADVTPKQDELLLAYMLEAWNNLKVDLWQLPRGEEVPAVQHLPKHQKVMQRLIEIFEKHDIIKRQGSGFIRGGKEPSKRSSGELYDSFLAQFPKYGGEARLMALTGPKLADCLTGKTDAVALMFKGTTAQKVMEDYYTRSPMLSTLTEQLVKFIEIVATKSDANGGAPIRIFEVGGGFGGTTTRLAEVLQASRAVEYTFTDIGPTLVKAAKSRFAQYPWMKFQSFNMENDVPPSLKGQYDIVIGTNCVHATTSKTASLSKLRQLLSPNGFVVLSEVTELVDWYDIVFGLLEGWWLAKDGSTYPLQPPESWMLSFKEAGFSSASYSQGLTPESNTQRLLVGTQKKVIVPPRNSPASLNRGGNASVETIAYKEVAGTKILADIYLPNPSPGKAMPVALMIHGGGHMTLSKKAIRPAQTAFLLANGVLPISLDYRLCPEVNLIDGPMTDIRDAYAWVQRGGLQDVLHDRGITIDTERIVIIGWSTGGHLAMSTAWTTKEAGLEPPKAILSFYGPTDFESGELDVRRAEMYPERRLSMDRILASLPTSPITSYHSDDVDTTGLGWVRPGDPRSELVLSLFKEGNGLSLMLNGIQAGKTGSWREPPDPKRVAAISPMAQLRAGNYTTPTYMIHSEKDEIVPFPTAVKFAAALKDHGVKSGLLAVKGEKHIHDLMLKPGAAKWDSQVAPGYAFLLGEIDK